MVKPGLQKGGVAANVRDSFAFDVTRKRCAKSKVILSSYLAEYDFRSSVIFKPLSRARVKGALAALMPRLSVGKDS